MASSSAMTLTIHRSKDAAEHSTVTISINGRLDAMEVPKLRKEFDDILAQISANSETKSIVVDLAEVSFIDSAALASLVRLRRESANAGCNLTLVQPASDDAMRIFKLTQFDQVFTMVTRKTEVVKARRVLVIDDDPVSRLVLSHLVAKQGFEVSEAENIDAAKKLAFSKNPDLILCDQCLPDGTGLDFLANLRRLGNTVPFVLVTGVAEFTGPEVAAEAPSLSGRLTKPVDSRSLVSCIADIWSGSL
ncbi:MAG: response regulator [Mycobacteriaceae bacterium]